MVSRDDDITAYTVKVGDDLVEEAEALDAPVVDALFRVEV